MISVRLLATWKNLVDDDRVAQCDATVRQTPNVSSYSPGMKMNQLQIPTEFALKYDV